MTEAVGLDQVGETVLKEIGLDVLNVGNMIILQDSHFSGQTKFPDFSLICRDFSLIFLEVLNKIFLGKYCLFF